MLDYIKELFNDKKTYTIFIVTFLVAVFVVIFFIWKPNGKVQEFARYQEVDLDKKYQEVGKGYLDELIIYFRYAQKGEILSRVSNNYLEYMNSTKEAVSNDIFSKNITGFSGLDIGIKGAFVVYTTDLIYGDGTKRTMNILEEIPYEYTISFDDFCSYEVEKISEISDGIIFNSDYSYSGLTKKSYEISITNRSNNNISFDLSDARKVCLELGDNQQYYLDSVIVTNKLNNISKGTTVNQELIFSIPFSVQGDVQKIIFKDVIIDDKVKDVEIDV